MIELKNIKKTFGKKTVFEGFNLKIAKGECVAIMGPSGSGKSTLLNIIGLIDHFDEGEYFLEGQRNIKVNSKESEGVIREKIAYIFQNFALIDSKTVEENLLLALYYVKKNKKDKKAMIRAALAEVGLSGYEDYKIFELSGGEQQRIAIARAFLKPNELVLADEPTGALDEENKLVILELLKTLNQKGKTIVIVTHDSSLASICSRVIELNAIG